MKHKTSTDTVIFIFSLPIAMVSVCVFLIWLIFVGFIVFGEHGTNLRPLLHVSAGLFGWVSLFALFNYSSRPISEIPRWCLYGCGVGLLSLTFVIYLYWFALPPILLLTLSLIRSYTIGSRRGQV